MVTGVTGTHESQGFCLNTEWQGMVAYACHPRTREVKAGRISGPPELQEMLKKKKKKSKTHNGKLKTISRFQYPQMEIEILFSSYVNSVTLL